MPMSQRGHIVPKAKDRDGVGTGDQLREERMGEAVSIVIFVFRQESIGLFVTKER